MLKAKPMAPLRGNLYWTNLGPVRGHEQDGRRPVLVMSSTSYNEKAGMALVCPLTSRRKNYTFEVVCGVPKASGVILADHVRSLDWRIRAFEHIAAAPVEIMAEVQGKLLALIS